MGVSCWKRWYRHIVFGELPQIFEILRLARCAGTTLRAPRRPPHHSCLRFPFREHSWDCHYFMAGSSSQSCKFFAFSVLNFIWLLLQSHILTIETGIRSWKAADSHRALSSIRTSSPRVVLLWSPERYSKRERHYRTKHLSVVFRRQTLPWRNWLWAKCPGTFGKILELQKMTFSLNSGSPSVQLSLSSRTWISPYEYVFWNTINVWEMCTKQYRTAWRYGLLEESNKSGFTAHQITLLSSKAWIPPSTRETLENPRYS